MEPGFSLHREHPFTTPAEQRDPARRLRGRLVGPVTVWTAGGVGAAEPLSGMEDSRAGLTVSSLLVAEGKEPALIGLLDPASDLWDRFEGTGRAVVNVLDWRHQTLAEVFAGRYPSPGGKFSTGDWSPGTHGPVLAGVPAQVAVELRGVTEVGWSILAECAIVAVTFADSDSDSGSSPGSGVDSSPAPGSGADSGAGSGVSRGEENKPADPLAYLRGRYRRLAPVSGSTPRSEGASVTS